MAEPHNQCTSRSSCVLNLVTLGSTAFASKGKHKYCYRQLAITPTHPCSSLWVRINQLKGSLKEPNTFHNYETEKITRKASDARQNISSCLFLPPEIFMHNAFNVILWTSANMRRRAWRSRVEETNNSIYSAASLALRVIFFSFIVVELIRFFHRALQLSVDKRNCFCTA